MAACGRCRALCGGASRRLRGSCRLHKKLAPSHPERDSRMSETRPRDGERPAVSIVVPVKNEAGNIEPLVVEIAAALAADGRFEIVYVDDGSSDATAEQLRSLM